MKMRKFLSFALLALFAVSCATSKLSQEEINKFSVKGNQVIYEGKSVAEYVNKEYEYSRGKFQFEFSVVQYDANDFELTEKIAKYLASKHPKAKIEIKLKQDVEKSETVNSPK